MEIKDVENLANLAKIELPEEEKVKILSDMESMVGYVGQIEEVQVGDVKEELEVYNAWREDVEAARDFSLELITKQFPDSKDGFLKVKKIL